MRSQIYLEVGAFLKKPEHVQGQDHQTEPEICLAAELEQPRGNIVLHQKLIHHIGRHKFSKIIANNLYISTKLPYTETILFKGCVAINSSSWTEAYLEILSTPYKILCLVLREMACIRTGTSNRTFDLLSSPFAAVKGLLHV